MSDRGLQMGPLPRDEPEVRPADLPPWSDAGIVGLLLGGTALFNFMILPIVRGVESGRNEAAMIFFVATAVGVYAGELALLTLGLVFGPGAFLPRLAVHWVVALGLYVAWALGFAAAIASESVPAGGIPMVWRIALCGLPLVSLAAQLPLWPLRIYFGWRIEQADKSGARPATPLLIRTYWPERSSQRSRWRSCGCSPGRLARAASCG